MTTLKKIPKNKVKRLFVLFDLPMICQFPSNILEGDWEIVNNALRSEEESLNSYNHLIAETKTLGETFHAVTLFHTCKQDNFVTHNLAKHTNYVSGFMI